MPYCVCGAFVTKQYVRVKVPEDVEQCRACPNCDGVREGAEIRKMRTPRGELNENTVIGDD